MRISKKPPKLHPKREVTYPEWLNISQNGAIAKTWRFHLQKYFYVEEHKNITILSTQVGALIAIDRGLNAATRVICSESVPELNDGLIFSHLETELGKSYSSAMTQATIIVSIWETCFRSGATLDLHLSEQVRDWYSRIRAEKEFDEWIHSIDISEFPEVREVAYYAACASKSIGHTVDNSTLLADICKNNILGPMTEFFGSDTTKIGPVEIKRALWAKFEKMRSALVQKFHSENRPRLKSYTLAMSKATFLYTVLHPVQNNARDRPSSSIVAPSAAVVASLRNMRRSTVR